MASVFTILSGETYAQIILAGRDSAAVGVLELRNYLIKPGGRERFIEYFEANFISSQWSLGGYVLGS